MYFLFSEKFSQSPFLNNFYELFSASGCNLLKKGGANDKIGFVR